MLTGIALMVVGLLMFGTVIKAAIGKRQSEPESPIHWSYDGWED